MAIRRAFLGWDWQQPALAAAAEYLRGQYARDGELDLSGVIVVVPGGRAARRLLEILVAVAEEKRVILTPPEIVTPERFPELLYDAKWPFADGLTQQLAWVEALRRAPRDVLTSFLPFPPEKDDAPRWLAIGETLRRLHLELAADGLDCRQVLQGADRVEGFAEHQRWKTLCELQQLYLKTLDALQLWDVQTARLVAIDKQEIKTDKQVVLVGAVDLNRAQRQMLDRIADRVTALIIAPREMAERFDEHGCLVLSKWTEAKLPLADEQMERVDGPAEQAEAVTRWLSSLDGKYRADQIAIGLPDEKLAPHIERQLAQCGLSGRWAIGKQLAETAPYRLLKVAADYAARRRFVDLAAVVRHSDVDAFVRNSEFRIQNSESRCFLEALDRFASERFPAMLDRERLAKEEDAADVLAVYEAVEELVAPLSTPSPRPSPKGRGSEEPSPRPSPRGRGGEERALAEWAGPLRAVLETVYGTRKLDRERMEDRYLYAALKQIAGALNGLQRVPSGLQPVVDVRQAGRIVLGLVAGEGIPPPEQPQSLEMLGWLDLPLDDSPAAIVTTFNEGWVPGSTTADAYLPNRLREALGLMHNDRRLARDAYALSLLCASRKELKVVVARRDSEGNPLAPSRLLFLTSAEKVVERACWFFGPLEGQAARRRLLGSQEPCFPLENTATQTPSPQPSPRGRGSYLSPPPRLSPPRLVPPRPERLTEPIAALSVTRFRDYLACPYRFYLRHIVGLERLDDEAEELDGGTFGGLAHTVLEQFGRAEEAKKVRVETQPKRIADYVCDKLDQIAAARFGKKLARPAVQVQIEQIRLRLEAFAGWQAERNQDGWRIVFSEDSEDRRLLKTEWAVDGKPFTLQGRIDRIDYHEALRKLCVVDYKTADRGDKPQQTHRRGDEWIDLQLPLYRHLVRAAKLPAGVPSDVPIELGYIVLPLDLQSVGLHLADWDEAALGSADEKAREIVRAIWDERFWPPVTPPPDFFEDVAVICQDRAMGPS